MKLNLRDECFKQDESMVRGRKSVIDWDRECREYNGWTFYTHRHIYPTNNPEKSVLMLWESEELSRDFCPTHKVLQFANNYKYILTSRSNLLNHPEVGKKCLFMPSGGIWLEKNQQSVYNKSKRMSIVSSDKAMCPLHYVRMQICQEFEKYIDIYGTLNGNWCEPIDYLKDYMYSVVIENNVDEYYFTEKLLNCFATGTIPIYIGAKKIGTFFNTDGIIQCTPDNIREKLMNVNHDYFLKKKEAIEDNFNRVQQFDTIELFIKNVYGELFCE